MEPDPRTGSVLEKEMVKLSKHVALALELSMPAARVDNVKTIAAQKKIIVLTAAAQIALNWPMLLNECYKKKSTPWTYTKQHIDTHSVGMVKKHKEILTMHAARIQW